MILRWFLRLEYRNRHGGNDGKNVADLISENPLVKKVLQTGADFEIRESSTTVPHRSSDPAPDEAWEHVDEYDVNATTVAQTADASRAQSVEERQEAVKSIFGGLNPPEEQIKL